MPLCVLCPQDLVLMAVSKSPINRKHCYALEMCSCGANGDAIKAVRLVNSRLGASIQARFLVNDRLWTGQG